ncbi:Aste57867_12079 [Aphanomyces stellatus]|uniref:Aste57867_12079 protein n=1 Tax=Aphanomyces stellatus TaxID=120398 RepID=A0A485KUL2_9STRA|nr:hypothetical protein As57867_012034 [Aphanomyces stellatus]VFT88934.1 Aste57867_12079 [Aphanomyces stellatus]
MTNKLIWRPMYTRDLIFVCFVLPVAPLPRHPSSTHLRSFNNPCADTTTASATVGGCFSPGFSSFVSSDGRVKNPNGRVRNPATHGCPATTAVGCGYISRVAGIRRSFSVRSTHRIMEFEAAAFVDAPVSQDLTKAITATAALSAGQVIFAESATVASAGGVEPEEGFHEENCDDEECGGCAAVDEEEEKEELDEEDLEQVSQYVKDNFDALMEACEPLEALAMVDVRKNLFKCFHLIDADAAALAPFQSMDVIADDVAASLEAAKALREAHAGVIPAALNDDQVAQLIGVLNKYCIPLDDIGGSGLFLYVSKLKHSCTPNASFTDNGNAIWVTAIQDIAVGEDITVDFFNTHYMCVAERQEVLAQEGQVCACAVCTGAAADKTRAFKCKVAGCAGIVHPTKDVFACATCANVWDADAIAAAEMEETTLMTDLDVENFEQLDKAINDSLLHAYHHIFYTAMEAVTDDSVVDISMSEEQALTILYRLIDALNYVVPFPHSEKVSLYNSIAQAQISNGDISKANEAYVHAHEICVKVFGPLCKETEMFKGLKDNTPTTVDEMAAAYGYELEPVDDDE